MKLIRNLATTSLVLAGALCLPAMGAAQNGVNYNGIVHFPVGSAQLQLASDGSVMAVTNLGNSGNDGVVSVLESAVEWDAKIRIHGNQPGDVLTLGAFAEGVRTAGARVELLSNGLKISGIFTGADGPSNYMVRVFQDDTLVGEFAGQDNSSSLSLDPLSPWTPPLEPIPRPEPLPWPWPWPDFRIGTVGNCIWGFQLGEDMVVSTSNGDSAVGNRVMLVEAPPTGGHSLYLDFDGLKLQSNGNTLVFEDENSISNGF